MVNKSTLQMAAALARHHHREERVDGDQKRHEEGEGAQVPRRDAEVVTHGGAHAAHDPLTPHERLTHNSHETDRVSFSAHRSVSTPNPRVESG